MKIILFIYLLAMTVITKGQDFEPSQQAQGYLNDKNVIVDYSTGIFHYKIPLYSLGTRDFQLPVCLVYTANGVSFEHQMGLIGFNWTLNTGGVITRTIRGGIADETSLYGYLWADKGSNTTPLENDIRRVNKRERDGECDIFTAVFNGQSLNFIIKMGQDNRIYAESLERTNVQIECESSSGKEINGWTITDENGNRYIYRQKEWSVDIIKEDAISFNGVRGEAYISSWYLNRIEPCNGEPIIFEYMEDVKESGEQHRININKYSSRYSSKFSYGKAMREHVFDFEKYRNRFNEAINEARSYLQGFSLEMQLNNRLNIYTRSVGWIRDPNFEATSDEIKANFRIMGQLAGFLGVANASNELVQTLNKLIAMYQDSPSQNAIMAASWFRTAKNYVMQSLNEIDSKVTTKEIPNCTMYEIRSPLLGSISCSDKYVDFEYSMGQDTKRLVNVKFRDLFKREISQIVIDGINEFDYLSFLDKNGLERYRFEFEYYKKPAGGKLIPDPWGYPGGLQDVDGKKYTSVVNANFSKIYSLKTITTPTGAKLTIDYEPNNYQNQNFGGIRIKSLFVDDNENNTHDTINYSYPLSGEAVFEEYSNKDIVSYTGFRDYVENSRVKYQNLAFLKSGNNGLYYSYVSTSY